MSGTETATNLNSSELCAACCHTKQSEWKCCMFSDKITFLHFNALC